MAFWRRGREQPPVEPVAPAESEPVESEPPALEVPAPLPPAPLPPESFEIEGFDGDAPAGAAPEPPIPTPAYAPFDPTAFLAVVPEGSLQTGLEKTRTGLVSQLRGYLGNADGPQWDEVEETLIAGDVGAALAIDLVERARKRREPGGPEAAIRAELQPPSARSERAPRRCRPAASRSVSLRCLPTPNGDHNGAEVHDVE